MLLVTSVDVALDSEWLDGDEIVLDDKRGAVFSLHS